MISYRRFDGTRDNDLADLTTTERTVLVSSRYRERRVSSYDEFVKQFPDVGHLDKLIVRQHFRGTPNLCLTIRPKAG